LVGVVFGFDGYNEPWRSLVKLAIRFKATDRSEALIEYVRQRVAGLADRRVDKLTVRFEDVNGPKGGLEKRCSISMRGSFGTCVVQTLDAEFFVGVERALALCERSLERSRGRRESLAVGPAFAVVVS
jgi:putative sigma-54 modulation protein